VELLTKVHHTIKVMIRFCLIFIFLIKLKSVNCQNSITGCYSSNFAIIGWFGTQIKFNDDKSFEYLFAGDLFYDKITGTYVVAKNQIILNYQKDIDSLEITITDSTGNLIPYKFLMPENSAINYRPSKLKIKGNRFLIYDRKGKIIRRKMNSREKWQKYYLVKITCEEMNI
jgi:hypothetical protein